jgi:hypothetical protein
MKRITTFLLAALLALQAAAGPFAATSSTTVPTSTFAGLPACASNSGAFYRVTNIGPSPGVVLMCDGTRWKPAAGTVRLYALAAPVTGLTNSEAISAQTLLPAGALQVNDQIRVWISGTKSGTTDASTLNLRVGTAGTTADAAVISMTPMSAAQQTFGGTVSLKLTSATASQRLGTMNATAGVAGSYDGGNATALPATVAIPSIASNANFVSVSMLSAGATNTVGLYEVLIEWVTP